MDPLLAVLGYFALANIVAWYAMWDADELPTLDDLRGRFA